MPAMTLYTNTSFTQAALPYDALHCASVGPAPPHKPHVVKLNGDTKESAEGANGGIGARGCDGGSGGDGGGEGGVVKSDGGGGAVFQVIDAQPSPILKVAASFGLHTPNSRSVSKVTLY
jgi:hypothetical protein